MRRLLILLALALAACNGNGDDLTARLEPLQHVPEISNLTLSPDSALYMEGDGSVQVTAALSYTDLGQDIETLHVMISDGTSLEVPVSAAATSVSSTLTVTFDMTTADANGCTVEIWLVDKAEQGSNHLNAAFSVIRHAPEILNVSLSPDSVSNMQGDGSVAVSAEISFQDTGLDIQTLFVRMPDDSIIEFTKSISTETGSFSEELTMPTQTVGTVVLEFWLVDKAGDDSVPVIAEFRVLADMQSSDWTNRVSGLPYTLNDVIWDGDVFIAVGAGGTVLTSADGIDWVARQSDTTADLNAIAVYGSEIFAVGDESVLFSTDHGANWRQAEKHFVSTELTAVAVTSSQVVVSGHSYGLAAGITSISEDRGESWQFVDFMQAGDFIYRDGLFLGVVIRHYGLDRASIMTSSDGKEWTEIVISEGGATLSTVMHNGSQFIVAGSDSAVFASFDGFNWTQLQTPVAGVNYLSSAWSGSKLVLAGGSDSPSDRPIGITSTDGGVTWETFNIAGTYESRGMAFGSGRFVSVGQTAPDSGEGAIYSTD